MSDADDARAVRSYWIEIVLLAVIAAISYLVIPLIGPLFCLVPLQALLVRRGVTAFGYGAALFGIAAVSFRLLTGWAGVPEQVAAGLMRGEAVVLILLIGGLYAVASPRFGRYRVLYRLLGATAAAGVITGPLIGGFLQNASAAAESFLMSWAQTTSASLGEELGDDALTGARAMADAFRAATPGVLRVYLVCYFGFLTFQWWVGTAIGARSARLPSPLRPVTQFRAPDQLVWMLVASLAVVVLDLAGALDRTGLEPLAAVAWNAGLVAAFVFGMQGVAVVRAFGAWYRRTGAATGLLILLVAVGLFAETWLLLIIPAFGASEIWIPYRQRLQAGESERDDDIERP